MEISSSKENANVQVDVIRVSGTVDSNNYQEFQKIADKLIHEGARYILMDFSDLKYISSAGLRVIHNTFNKLRSLHKDVNDAELQKKMASGEYKSPFVKVSGLSETVRNAFEISGFDTYIEIHEDASGALAAF